MKFKIRINWKKVEALLPVAEELFGNKLSDTEKTALGLILHQAVPESTLNGVISEANNDAGTATPK